MAAFFDVDDTLVRGFTIASFVHFILGKLGDRSLVAELLELERQAATYPSREALVRECFRLLAGQSWAELSSWGRQWYDQVGRGLLIPETVSFLAKHRQRGDLVVLVSGSWLPCLVPLAADLGAEYVYGCEVEVTDGLLTGRVVTVMVGAAKADALRGFAGRHRVDLRECFAYGDHASDVDMLSLVGHPVVVGASPVLTDLATHKGWPVVVV